MVDALEQADRADTVRVVLLTGSGDSYTAGNDISDFQRSAPAEGPSGASVFGDRLVRFTKPIVAAVNGLAVGIGTTMLLHCDLVYASEEAQRWCIEADGLAQVSEYTVTSCDVN